MAGSKPRKDKPPKSRGRPAAIFRGRAAVAKRHREAAEAAAEDGEPRSATTNSFPSLARKGIEALKGLSQLRSRLLTRRCLENFETQTQSGKPDFLAPAVLNASWRHVTDVPTHEVYKWFENEVWAIVVSFEARCAGSNETQFPPPPSSMTMCATASSDAVPQRRPGSVIRATHPLTSEHESSW